MGVFWNSEAEILTKNKDLAKGIMTFIKSIDDTFEDYKLYDVNISDCSIRFSSKGYGSYETLFSDICNKFEFPIFCHERVLPSQGQGYGFFNLCGRWENGSICTYQENVYEDYDGSDPDDSWVDSAQILSIPEHFFSEPNSNMSEKRREELNAIIKRASDAGTPIESSPAWFDEDSNLYYRNNFVDNCIAEDEDRVNEIFEDELINMCTWNTGIWFNFVDEDENEMDGLPENIDCAKLRLVFKD